MVDVNGVLNGWGGSFSLVTQEYVDLYNGSEQDSHNLNEPLININNGVGCLPVLTR